MNRFTQSLFSHLSLKNLYYNQSCIYVQDTGCSLGARIKMIQKISLCSLCVNTTLSVFFWNFCAINHLNHIHTVFRYSLYSSSPDFCERNDQYLLQLSWFLGYRWFLKYDNLDLPSYFLIFMQNLKLKIIVFKIHNTELNWKQRRNSPLLFIFK